MTGVGKNGVADTVLPDGWCETSIGAHFEFKNGLNKAKEFFGYGTPIVNYMDVYRHPWLLPSHVSGKVDVTKNEQQAYSARQHDAFFTRTSETVDEIGMCAVLMEPIECAVFSGFVLRARPFNDKLSLSFAAYALRGRTVRQQIESSATYTTRALTNGKSLSAVTFALPPPKEQERISAALKDIDDLIASLDALIAKKRDIKQAAMQQLLTGKTRLPGFEGEWLERKLGTEIKMQVGFPFASRFFNRGGQGTKLVRNRDLHGTPDDTYYAGPFDEEYLITNGDVLVGMDGDFSPSLWAGGGALLNQRVGRIKCKSGRGALFFYYLLESHLAELEKKIAGTTVKHLSHSDVENITCFFPQSVEEQSTIGSLLREVDSEIEMLEAKLSKAAVLKQGMMQQLLTGRIRLV